MTLGNKYRKNHVRIFEELANKPALIMGFLPGLTQKDYFLNVLIGQTNSNPTSFSQLGGVTKGLDKANKILVPSLFLIIFVMMIYTMTLDGALTDAFGQAFFMLSTLIAVATIIVALTSTCTVFATISAIAKNQNLPINEVFKPGPTLIFQVFPQIFAIIAQNTSLLVLSHILAIFFFLSIFFAGISSLIAMLETVVNPLEIE
ncbi:snf family na+-dependent transporter [Lasius niger]|uniref:Snf family na+-dependent transporter n=1 Tax=Lasius niger TaxID=67767 RepID=A0A0J7KXX7_LASNI|nr:snf family na+-dependent transporter [Lasius niger]